MITLSKSEALRFKNEIIAKVTASRIPGSVTNELFHFYKTYINSTRFKEMPCSCSPQLWKEILQSVVSLVNETLNGPDVPVDALEAPQHIEQMEEGVTIPEAVQEDMELQDASQMPAPKRTYKRKPKA